MQFADHGLNRKLSDALRGDVGAYHECVATMAFAFDDGESSIDSVSTAAMAFCEPRAKTVWGLLQSAHTPTDISLAYIQNLLSVARYQSTAMLRRNRYPDWNDRRI